MPLEMFTAIADTLPEPCLLLRQDGVVVAANEAARKRYTLTPVTAGANLSELVLDGAEKVRQLLNMWSRSSALLPGMLTLKGVDDPVLARCLCKGKRIMTGGANEAPLILMQCGNKQHATAAFLTLNENIEQLKREIIERRRIEEEFRLLNQSLEARVAERTSELHQRNLELNSSLKELQAAQEQLVRSERLAALGGMVAGIAHEINTPVGIGVTAASFLEEQVSRYKIKYESNTLTRADFEAMLKIAAESSAIVLANLNRAATLVRSFKQVAVDQTSDVWRHINLKQYLEEILISLKPALRRTSHAIFCDCPDDIEIDSYPGALAQIINNLVHNSLLHGFEKREQGEMRIAVSRSEDELQLHYSDNGCGAPASTLTQIFDPFFTTKRNRGGSGLGMNIVYNLVTHKLGGKISVKSVEREGIAFLIQLPAPRLLD